MKRCQHLLLGFPGVAFLALLLASCAYVYPYVSLYPEVEKPPQTTEPLPNVSKATRALDVWSKDVEHKRDDLTTNNRKLNLATFGLAAGAAIAPVYNAYKDLVTALALGAGTAYSANTLFLPSDQGTLYNAALTALVCIKNKAGALQAAYTDPDVLQQEFTNSTTNHISDDCKKDPSYTTLENAVVTAKSAMQTAANTDYSAGLKLLGAGQNVVVALNRETEKRAASSEAIFAAAKSLGSLAVSPVPAPQKRVNERRPIPACTADETAIITAAITAYQNRKKAVDTALEGIGDLATVCSFDIAPIADLKVSQDAVTIAANSHVNITVTGGRPPYTANWETDDPASNGIILQPNPPQVFTLHGTADIKTAKTYTLIISDSSIGMTSRKVVVTAKP